MGWGHVALSILILIVAANVLAVLVLGAASQRRAESERSPSSRDVAGT
jgi:hypothetical protein